MRLMLSSIIFYVGNTKRAIQPATVKTAALPFCTTCDG